MSADVIWITGLSGAGKTTLAKAVLPCLPPPAVMLDGDKVRDVLRYAGFGYDKESRRRIGHTYARLAHFLAEQDITVVCAVVAMSHEVHAWSRSNIKKYHEIFLDVPREELLRRDYKGVYGNANGSSADSAGSPGPVVGRDIPPEFPEHPDLVLPYNNTVEENAKTVLKYLLKLPAED